MRRLLQASSIKIYKNHFRFLKHDESVSAAKMHFLVVSLFVLRRPIYSPVVASAYRRLYLSYFSNVSSESSGLSPGAESSGATSGEAESSRAER